MVPRLYLETTIPSYLVSRPSRDPRLAADQEATKEWWEQQRKSFELFISVVVLREVQRGDPNFAAARLAIIQGVPILTASTAAEELAEKLIAEGIIPAIAADDAAHVAIAAANEIEFLLTWNCTHINNRFILRRLEAACSDHGFQCPVICTPPELMNLIP